jgi:hypothetical protein
MLKLIIAVVMIIAMLSVAGCCCCSGTGYDSYYSTVGQEETSTCSCDTPYDCPSGACGAACACP